MDDFPNVEKPERPLAEATGFPNSALDAAGLLWSQVLRRLFTQTLL